MTLTNKSKINDVITSLQDTQLINQKSELASVVGSDSDTTMGQILAIQDAKNTLAGKMEVDNTLPLQAMAQGLSMGKKWASGTATLDVRQLTVEGLTFKPKLILVNADESNINLASWIIVQNITDNYEIPKIIVTHNISSATYNTVVNQDKTLSVGETGFTLGVSHTGWAVTIGATVSWLVIG